MPFRTIFEAAPTAMVVAGMDLCIVEVNAAFARLLGYRPAALRGKPIVDITHPEDVEATRQALMRGTRGERPSAIEKRYLRKDGTEVHALTSVGILRSDSGQPRYMLAAVQDLSEKVRAEVAARRSESELHQFAEHVHDGVWISDGERQTFSFLSETTARLWGVEREAIIADPNALAALVDPEDLERLTEAVKQLEVGPVEVRIRVTPPGKALRWLRLRMFPMHDEQGRLTRVAGLTEDVTDQHAAAELLEQTQRQAIRLVQALRAPMSVLTKALGGPADNGDAADRELPPSTVADSIARERIDEFHRRAAALTVRERQVMDLIVDGKSTRQIANHLGLSPKTVETHRAHLLRKTGVSSIAELVRLVVLWLRKSPIE